MFVMLESSLSLLSSLSGTSDEIRDSIVSRFPELPLFDLDVIANVNIPETAKVLAAENLCIMSEQNIIYQHVIQASGFVLNDDVSVPVRMYMTGVEYNILESSSTKSIDIVSVVRSLCSEMAAVDIEAFLKQLDPVTIDGVESVPKTDDHRSTAQNNVIALQLGLELATVISESLGKFNTQGKSSSKSHTGNVNGNESSDEAMSDVDGVNSDEEINGFPTEGEDQSIAKTEKSSGGQYSHARSAAEILLEDALPLVVSLMKFKLLQSRAATALNNMCWTFDSLCASSPSWMELSRTNFITLSSVLRELAYDNTEASTGIIGTLWACACQCKGDIPLDVSNVRWLVKYYNDLEDTEMTLECRVRIVGLFGVLAQRQGHVDVTQEIGIFLITQVLALPNAHSEIVIEALNAIYDIFADKTFDYDSEVFVKGSFLKHLVSILPQVRQMAKKIDKRRDLLLRTKADEAVLNLSRFIAYKSKER